MAVALRVARALFYLPFVPSFASQGYGFQPSYDGEELSCTVKNLHRSTKYKFRVRERRVVCSRSRPRAAFDFSTSETWLGDGLQTGRMPRPTADL